jgi:hypothetical protein
MSMQDSPESPVKAALRLGPIQVVVIAIVAIIAIAGAVVTIVKPSTLSFEQYSTQVIPELVAGLGVLGIGKGLHLGLAGRTEQKVLEHAPDLLTALEHGQVAHALALVQGDFQTETPQAPRERLPTEREMAAAPPPPDAELPPLPEPIADAGPDLPAGTGLAADDAGTGAVAPPPPPTQAEIDEAREILDRAGL